MLEKAGCKEVTIFDSNAPIGKGIHEMGTARMEKIQKHLFLINIIKYIVSLMFLLLMVLL